MGPAAVLPMWPLRRTIRIVVLVSVGPPGGAVLVPMVPSARAVVAVRSASVLALCCSVGTVRPPGGGSIRVVRPPGGGAVGIVRPVGGGSVRVVGPPGGGAVGGDVLVVVRVVRPAVRGLRQRALLPVTGDPGPVDVDHVPGVGAVADHGAHLVERLAAGAGEHVLPGEVDAGAVDADDGVGGLGGDGVGAVGDGDGAVDDADGAPAEVAAAAAAVGVGGAATVGRGAGPDQAQGLERGEEIK